ncbi:PHO85 cyclin-1 [Coemansia sp. RSA 1933]|nr:PHO85 cyclin-1 [Coemansia sp. RSA 1933]
MSTAIATPSGGVASVDLGRVHEQQLLRTAAFSLKSLLRTDGHRSDSAQHQQILLNPMLPNLPSIETFIFNITTNLDVKTTVLVTALIYVERLSRRLPESATGTADTPYRIFLASLLLADKFWSDSAMPVKSLVAATGGVFAQREISNMERALLKLLGFNLFVSADQVRTHAQTIGFVIANV